MTQEENNTIEAEVISSEIVKDPLRITVDPRKVLKRMMQGGWRTATTKKNLSPNRVEKRRKKNKAARKSRKHK